MASNLCLALAVAMATVEGGKLKADKKKFETRKLKVTWHNIRKHLECFFFLKKIAKKLHVMFAKIPKKIAEICCFFLKNSRKIGWNLHVFCQKFANNFHVIFAKFREIVAKICRFFLKNSRNNFRYLLVFPQKIRRNLHVFHHKFANNFHVIFSKIREKLACFFQNFAKNVPKFPDLF